MTTQNLLPILTASTSADEMLALIQDPEAAIGFALEHLQPFELHEFFTERRDGKDLRPWLDAMKRDQRFVAENFGQ